MGSELGQESVYFEDCKLSAIGSLQSSPGKRKRRSEELVRPEGMDRRAHDEGRRGTHRIPLLLPLSAHDLAETDGYLPLRVLPTPGCSVIPALEHAGAESELKREFGRESAFFEVVPPFGI